LAFFILDEAQAIKNPNAQTKRRKALRQGRIVLTGTPVENHFGDLWSIFDSSTGLLGNANNSPLYQRLADGRIIPTALRELVRPYILRRMKTDKSVIATFLTRPRSRRCAGCRAGKLRCTARLSKTLQKLEHRRHSAEGHRPGDADATQQSAPSLPMLNDNVWAEKDSGKWHACVKSPRSSPRGRRRSGVHAVREMTGPLAPSWADFGPPAWCCTVRPRGEPQNLVAFQEDEAVSFFVLS